MFCQCDDIVFLRHLASCVNALDIAQGRILYLKYDKADEIYFVKSGSLKLLTIENNYFRTASKGETVGDYDTLVDQPRLAKCIVHSKATLYVLTRRNFERLIQFAPEFCNKMYE